MSPAVTFIFVFVLSVLLSTALIPVLRRLALALRMIDVPDERKTHTGSIPRVGGVAIVLGAVLPISLWVSVESDIRAYLVGALVIFGFGLWDDRGALDYRLKFLGQFAAACIMVAMSGLIITHVPFALHQTLPPELGIVATVLMLVGFTNAVNLCDGLDGLAGGTTLLALGGMTVLGFEAGDRDLALVGVAICGAVLGFLRYNTYPAKVFMGDAGSQVLGFSVGCFALIIMEKGNSAISPVVFVMLLGLPVLDTIAVMIQRIMEGHSPFKADRNHIHHKLVALGLNHYEAVFAIYLMTAGLVSVALFFRYASDLLLGTIYGAFCATILATFHVGLHKGWKLVDSTPHLLVCRGIDFLHHTGWLAKASWYFAKLSVPVLFLFAALTCVEVYWDIAVACLVLLGMVASMITWMPQRYSVVERLATFVTAAIVVYMLEYQSGWMEGIEVYENALFVMLGVAVAVWARFAAGDVFEVSPLDFLVVCIVALVPYLSEVLLRTPVDGTTAIKMLVLFYACEMQFSYRPKYPNPIRYSVLCTLIILGARGFV